MQALRGEETLQIDPGPGMPQVQSEGSFALRYLSSQPLTDAAARADRALGDDYELIAMAVAEQDPQSERRSDEQLLAGASFPDLLSQLSRLNATSDGAVQAELCRGWLPCCDCSPRSQRRRKTHPERSQRGDDADAAGALGQRARERRRPAWSDWPRIARCLPMCAATPWPCWAWESTPATQRWVR